MRPNYFKNSPPNNNFTIKKRVGRSSRVLRYLCTKFLFLLTEGKVDGDRGDHFNRLSV